MAKKADAIEEARSSWLQSVYGDPSETPEGLKKYQMCKHCKEVMGHHIGEELKCPFDATTFEVWISPVKP